MRASPEAHPPAPHGAWLWWAVLALWGAFALLPLGAALLPIVTEAGEARAALLDGRLWRRLGESLLLVGGALALAVPLGAALAWCLVRTRLPGARLVVALAFFPIVLPPLVHVLTWYSALGLVGRTAVIVVYAISVLPLVVVLAAQAIESASRQHVDSLLLTGGIGLLLADDARRCVPACALAGALGGVLLISDFTVADFATSLGPKVSTYAETLFAHVSAMREGRAAAAMLPGLLVGSGLLVWGLWARRRLGHTFGRAYAPGEAVVQGPVRWVAGVLAIVVVLALAMGPLVALAVQTQSGSVFAEQFRLALPALRRSLLVGLMGGGIMAALAVLVAILARGRSHRALADAWFVLPIGAPAIAFAFGLIVVWNRPAFDAVYLGIGILLIAVVARFFGTALIPVSDTVDALDRSGLEAARLAGAGPLAATFWTALPLLLRPVAVGWCLGFCFAQRDLDALFMFRASQETLLHRLYTNVVFARPDETAALALLLTLTVAVPFVLLVAVIVFLDPWRRRSKR